MAGEGSRFKINGYEKPKPLIPVDGVPMIKLAIDSLNIEGRYIFVIRKYQDPNNTLELKNLLKKIKPDCVIVEVEKLTRGSTETCLHASEWIDNDSPLVITNCDQFMQWDSTGFMNFIESGCDGSVVTYTSTDPKNSFVKVNDQGEATYFKEKDPISNIALIGLHYWKMGSDFVSSSRDMIIRNERQVNEFYIAPTYNYLISKGKKITNYHLSENQYHSLGTPKDLHIYLGKKKEFSYDKPKTIICDLDGTIFKHCHRYSSLKDIEPELNPGVIEKFNSWDSIGFKIILMTGRKESGRALTVKALEKLGIPYDTLLMGVGNGPRVLINDKLSKHSHNRAISVNVVTDEGFETIDWEKLGL